MQKSVVLTVLGPDRPGLVQELADWVVQAGGNWQESHMRHLQGRFAGIVECSLPETELSKLDALLVDLKERTGLEGCWQSGEQEESHRNEYSFSILGQDRPGLVHALTELLLKNEVNILQLESSRQSAPMSGEQLFQAHFHVNLPEGLEPDDLAEQLSPLGEELMLDLDA